MANGAVIRPRRSLAGPIVLIVIGALFLVRNLGYPIPLLHLFASYWPVLIILWGVVKLVEHYRARQEGVPAPGIGVGGYFLLFFLIMFGVAASTAARVNWGPVVDELDLDADVVAFFGTRHEFTEELEHELASGQLLRVTSERGSVKIVPSDEPGVRVKVSKSIFASNESAARRLHEQITPQFNREGKVLVLNAERSRGARVNLEVHVPRDAPVEVMAVRGDVEVTGRGANVKVHASRGGVRLEDIQGSVTVHLRRGDFTARNVSGDVNIEGRVSDATLVNVGGMADLRGDFFGAIRVSNAAKGVRFKSSRTDLEFARLDGELVMEGGNLVARSLEGPVRLLTRSKDIRIEDFSGDVRLENSNGFVRLEPRTLGAMQVENRRGDIELRLPSNARFQLDARTRRGDIRSDFDLNTDSAGSETRATGSVGTGGPSLRLNSEAGSIAILKAG